MKKLILLLLPITMFAQPSGPVNNPVFGNCNSACYTPNPPQRCDCNPVPLNKHLMFLGILGAALVVFYHHYNNLKLKYGNKEKQIVVSIR